MDDREQAKYNALVDQRDELRRLSLIYYDALRAIRDSTHKNALTLRGMAANALEVVKKPRNG